MNGDKRKQRDFSGFTMLLLGIAALLVLLLIAYGVMSSNVDIVKRVLGDTSSSGGEFAEFTPIPESYEKDYAGADVVVAGDMYGDKSGAEEKPLDDKELQNLLGSGTWSDDAVG